jgi:hypothetical protein
VPSIAHYRHAPDTDDSIALTDTSQEKVEELVVVHVLKYHRHIAYFAFGEHTLVAIAREIIFIYNHLPLSQQSSLPPWFAAYVPNPERLRLSQATMAAAASDEPTLGGVPGISTLSPSPLPHHPANPDRLNDHAATLFHPSAAAYAHHHPHHHVAAAAPATSSTPMSPTSSSDESSVGSSPGSSHGHTIEAARAAAASVEASRSPSPNVTSPRPARAFSPNVSILSPLPTYPLPSTTNTINTTTTMAASSTEDEPYAADFDDDDAPASASSRSRSRPVTHTSNGGVATAVTASVSVSTPRLPPLRATTVPLSVTSAQSTPRSARDWTTPPLTAHIHATVAAPIVNASSITPSNSGYEAPSVTVVPPTMSDPSSSSRPSSDGKANFAATLASALSSGGGLSARRPQSSTDVIASSTPTIDPKQPLQHDDDSNDDDNTSPVLQHMRRASLSKSSGRRRPSTTTLTKNVDQIFGAHTSPRSGTTTLLQQHVSPPQTTVSSSVVSNIAPVTAVSPPATAAAIATALSPPVTAATNPQPISPSLEPLPSSISPPQGGSVNSGMSINRAISFSPPAGIRSPPPPNVGALRTDSSLLPLELGALASSPIAIAAVALLSSPRFSATIRPGSPGSNSSGSPLGGLNGSIDVAMSPRERRERARADRERARDRPATSTITAGSPVLTRPSSSMASRIDLPTAAAAPGSPITKPSNGLQFNGMESPRVAHTSSGTPTSFAAGNGSGTPTESARERRERARMDRERERIRQREEADALERQREKERMERREAEMKQRRERRNGLERTNSSGSLLSITERPTTSTAPPTTTINSGNTMNGTAIPNDTTRPPSSTKDGASGVGNMSQRSIHTSTSVASTTGVPVPVVAAISSRPATTTTSSTLMNDTKVSDEVTATIRRPPSVSSVVPENVIQPAVEPMSQPSRPASVANNNTNNSNNNEASRHGSGDVDEQKASSSHGRTRELTNDIALNDEEFEEEPMGVANTSSIPPVEVTSVLSRPTTVASTTAATAIGGSSRPTSTSSISSLDIPASARTATAAASTTPTTAAIAVTTMTSMMPTNDEGVGDNNDAPSDNDIPTGKVTNELSSLTDDFDGEEAIPIDGPHSTAKAHDANADPRIASSITTPTPRPSSSSAVAAPINSDNHDTSIDSAVGGLVRPSSIAAAAPLPSVARIPSSASSVGVTTTTTAVSVDQPFMISTPMIDESSIVAVDLQRSVSKELRNETHDFDDDLFGFDEEAIPIDTPHTAAPSPALALADNPTPSLPPPVLTASPLLTVAKRSLRHDGGTPANGNSNEFGGSSPLNDSVFGDDLNLTSSTLPPIHD